MDTMLDEMDARFRVAVVDFAAPDASQRFTDSLKTTGFAVLTNHPVADELTSGVYAEWRDFLTRLHRDATSAAEGGGGTAGLEEVAAGEGEGNLAARYLRDPIKQAGYFPMSRAETAKGATAQDLKHYYQLYFPNARYYPDEVSDRAEALWRELLALGKTLVGWIDEHMPADVRATIQAKIGAGVTLADCVSDDRTMLRVLHYPGGLASARPAGAVRAAPHEDINLITVLPAGSSRGLQVTRLSLSGLRAGSCLVDSVFRVDCRRIEGGSAVPRAHSRRRRPPPQVRANQEGAWHEVPPVPGSIVINVGDMLQEMSGRAYVSTTHRVVEMADAAADGVGGDGDGGDPFLRGDRMSTPCFVHLKSKCPLSDRYGSAEHYLLERLVTLGVVPPDTAEAFLREHAGGVVPGWDPKEE